MIDNKTRDEIKDFYLHGKGSIQDYARMYRLSVEEVLDILELQDMKQVTFGGDMIDQTEAGPGTTLNYGTQISVPFSSN